MTSADSGAALPADFAFKPHCSIAPNSNHFLVQPLLFQAIIDHLRPQFIHFNVQRHHFLANSNLKSMRTIEIYVISSHALAAQFLDFLYYYYPTDLNLYSWIPLFE